jgi:3-hydroxy-9,10-secoandrosta-1,3,5(10)-triene-9,17-dione monooxygenase
MSHAADTRVPTTPEIVARIADLREQLGEEQAETEARRYHSESLHRALVESGVYRMLLPRLWGGFELSMGDFYTAVAEVARGCPSTGWCVCLAGSHVLTVSSIFSEAVQSEIFAPDGDFRCPARALPHGTATPTDDGWGVKGRWDYCSGAPYATHLLAAVRLPAEGDGAPPTGCAIIPRSQWTMQDDWGDQLGMKGSGSHSVEADAVLPEGYVLPVSIQDVHPGEHTVGYEIHGNPMYAGRTSGFYAGELTAVGIGAVRGALDEYAQSLRTRKTYWVPQVIRGEDAQYQQWYGRAQMLVDTAEGALIHMTRLYDRYCRDHVDGVEPFTVGKDTRLMAIAINASATCVEAMDLIIRTAGATSLKQGSRMERLWRDMSTFRTHLSQTMRESIETTAGAAQFVPDKGRVQFGVLEPRTRQGFA